MLIFNISNKFLVFYIKNKPNKFTMLNTKIYPNYVIGKRSQTHKAKVRLVKKTYFVS